MLPGSTPVAVHSLVPPGSASAATQTNAAPRLSMSASWPSTSSRLARSSPCLPAQRAERMPGIPLSASTVRPESSETAGSPVCAAIARALSSALSANVLPVSGTSGASGNWSRPTSSPGNPASARIRLSSATLCAFRVASTTRGRGAPARELAATARLGLQRHVLQAGQFRAPGRAQVKKAVQQRAGERLALGGALDLHEVPGAGADHVHVGLGRRVFLVAEVQPRLAADDADGDRGDGGDQRAALELAALAQPVDRVRERHVSPGDRGGPGAAVGLQDVAVDDDRVLAERLVVDAGAQRPPDEPGDLVRPAAA